jgi:hypothetical protein
VALIYNWWNWYCRAARPEAHIEAITSRALLLAAVGRAIRHAGKTTLYLSQIRTTKKTLMRLISNTDASRYWIRRRRTKSSATKYGCVTLTLHLQ